MTDNTQAIPGELKKGKRYMLIDLIVRLVKEKPLGTVGGVIVIFMFLVGIFANFVAPQGMSEINLAARLLPPTSAYPLGTDSLGRDVLSRIIYGARTSMIIGLGAPSISVFISLLVGGVSGYLGGKYDLVVQRLVDSWMAFPPLIVTLTVMSLLGPGLYQVLVVLGVWGGFTSARVTRSAVISIKENVYIDAAQAIGCPNRTIFLKHILPNIMPVLIIIFTTYMAGSILAEAAISFLGFGVPAPHPSWGGMLSSDGRKYMLQSPGLAFWPGFALSITVYGISMLGDAIRDVLDPRLRGGIGRYDSGKKRSASAEKGS